MLSRMFRYGVHSFASVVLLGVLPNGYAATLHDVVQHTVCTNPDVLIATKVKLASNEGVKGAYARYYPVVDFNATIGRESSDNSSTDFNNRSLWRRELGIQARENLFEGFTTKYEVLRNKAKTDADAYAVQGSAEDQALAATEAYIDVLRTRDLIANAQDNLETHNRMFNMIKERGKSGVGREADVSQATGRHALAESNLYAAQNDLRNAKTLFFKITGLNADHLVMPPIPSDSILPNDFDAAINKALKNHPKMQMAVTDVEEARAQHNVSHATAFPVVDFVVQANNGHNIGGQEGRSNSYAALLELNYNLFRGGKDVARQRETAYQTQQAAEIRNRTCRQTMENMNLAWNTLITAKKRLPTLYQHKVSSTETARAYQDQFRLDKRTLLDVLDTENERFKAGQEYINGRYAVLTGKYRILGAMGELTSFLHVTIPEESRPQYGQYYAEANPVVVKRHIEAGIQYQDKPAAWYHKDTPPQTPIANQMPATPSDGYYIGHSRHTKPSPRTIKTHRFNASQNADNAKVLAARQRNQRGLNRKQADLTTSTTTAAQQDTFTDQHSAEQRQYSNNEYNSPEQSQIAEEDRFADEDLQQDSRQTPSQTAPKVASNRQQASLNEMSSSSDTENQTQSQTAPKSGQYRQQALSNEIPSSSDAENQMQSSLEQEASALNVAESRASEQTRKAQRQSAQTAKQHSRTAQILRSRPATSAATADHDIAYQSSEEDSHSISQNENTEGFHDAEGQSTEIPVVDRQLQHTSTPKSKIARQRSTKQLVNDEYLPGSGLSQSSSHQTASNRINHQSQRQQTSNDDFSAQSDESIQQQMAQLGETQRSRAQRAQTNSKYAENQAVQTQQTSEEQFSSTSQQAPTKTVNVVKTGPELNGWAVQIGTFKDQSDVDNIVLKLRSNGMNGFMREIQANNTTTFEVFVGPIQQRAEAAKLVKKLQALNLGGSIVRAEI